MLPADERIKSGRTYLVHFFGQLYRAKVLWPADAPRGWWQCRLSQSLETLVPEESFIQECDDASQQLPAAPPSTG